MFGCLKIKEEVMVISGSHKGESGELFAFNKDKTRAYVKGVAMVKHHSKSPKRGEPGKIESKEGSIHISNLMLLSRFNERQSKRSK